MKILHLITINAIGGAEKLMPVFLPALKKTGFDVHCLLLYHKNYPPDAANEVSGELNRNGISNYIVKCGSLFDRNARNKIAEIINKEKFDFAHSHLKYADFYLSWLKFRKKINIPVITTMHGYRDSYQNQYGLSVRRRIYFSIYYWVTKFIFSRLDGFVFISSCMKDFYLQANLLKGKWHKVIHHGYPSISFIRNDYMSGKNGLPSLCLPGRLIKLKGHKFAIEVIKLLVNDYPGIVLHIYGTGPEEDNLKTLVKSSGLDSKIIFHGYVDHLQDELQKMDIVLIPSHGEAFGMVFLDAFAAGAPVVAFDLPAGNEIVANGHNGLLAKYPDVNDLSVQIKRLCADRFHYQQIRTKAYDSLEKDFSLNRMINDYSVFYKKILENN